MGILNAVPGAVAQGLIYSILALGVYVTFRLLDFADLTVDNSLCTGGAVCAMLVLNGQPMWLGILMAIIAGMLAGAVTGFLHTVLKIPPILAGILTQLSLYSINMRIMGKSNQPLLQIETLVSNGNNTKTLIVGGIIVAVVVLVLYWFFGTEVGCAIRATGNNGNMARALGVSTGLMTVIGLMLSNGLVGLSGALLSQYLGNSDINIGRGAIVIGLASVIIGEVVFGSRFNFIYKLISIVVGSVLYQLIIAIVIQLGLGQQDLKMFSAIIVAIALAMPTLKTKIKTNQMLKAKKQVTGEEAK